MMSLIIAGGLAAVVVAAYVMKMPRGETADWPSWIVGIATGLFGALAVFLMLNGLDLVYQIVTALMALVGIGTTVVRLKAGFAHPA